MQHGSYSCSSQALFLPSPMQQPKDTNPIQGISGGWSLDLWQQYFRQVHNLKQELSKWHEWESRCKGNTRKKPKQVGKKQKEGIHLPEGSSHGRARSEPWGGGQMCLVQVLGCRMGTLCDWAKAPACAHGKAPGGCSFLRLQRPNCAVQHRRIQHTIITSVHGTELPKGCSADAPIY